MSLSETAMTNTRADSIRKLYPMAGRVRRVQRVGDTRVRLYGTTRYSGPFTVDQLARDERPYLSAISLWEVAMLVERL